MKKVIIDYCEETLTVFNEKKQNWETCNFIEAGIANIDDRDDIENHIRDSEESDVDLVIEWKYSGVLSADEVDRHFGFNPVTDCPEDNVSFAAYFTVEPENGLIVVNVGNQRFGAYEIH